MSSRSKIAGGRALPIAGRDKPVTDPYYRYQMPAIVCRYEKTWTVVINLAQVARALRRDETEVLKFWAVELGTQTRFQHGAAMVKGQHKAQILQDALGLYIDAFVLCGTCDRPETVYTCKKQRRYDQVVQICLGCGAHTPVECVDNEAVSKLIVRSYKAHVAAKKKKKKEKIEVGGDEKPPKEKKKKPKNEKSIKPTCPGPEEMDDLDALEEAIEQVSSFLATNPKAPPEMILRTLIREQKLSVLMVKERLRILVRACLLSPEGEDTKQIASTMVDRWTPVLCALIEESPMMRLYLQGYLIACLEEAFLLGAWSKCLFVMFLKALYDQDLLEESVILEWASVGVGDKSPSDGLVDESTRALLVRAAHPFVVWLEEAEEESSSGEE